MQITEYLKSMYKPNDLMVVNLPTINRSLGGIPIYQWEKREKMHVWELIEKIEEMGIDYPMGVTGAAIYLDEQGRRTPFYFAENGDVKVRTATDFIFFFCTKHIEVSEIEIPEQESEEPKRKPRRKKGELQDGQSEASL